MSSSLDRLSKVLFVTAFFLLAAALMVGCQPATPTPMPTPTPVPVVDDDVGLAGTADAANETEAPVGSGVWRRVGPSADVVACSP